MTNLTRSIAKSVPRPLTRAVKRVAFFGSSRYCPVCEHSLRKMLLAGNPPRLDARCPLCNARERHRLVWRYFQERSNFFQMSGAKMLHVAAEPWFEPKFRAIIGSGYLTADLMRPADVKMDVTDIQFADNTFDVIYCSHVLEHVADDRQAMREFRRVLKPEGFAILLVPVTVETTVEDPTITDPRERLRLFGQDDHVRCYGPDYLDRLREAGFDVLITEAKDFLDREEIERIAVGTAAAGQIYHCRKMR